MSIELAEQFEQNEQFDKAYEEFKKLLEKRPKSIELLERTAHLAMLLNKSEDAESYYSRILELDATSVLAYEQLMDVFIHTDKYKYYVYRGNLHVCQNQPSHAINDFKKALDKAQTEKDILNTRFVLAGLYEQAGKYNLAIDEYLRIIDFDEATELSYIKLAKIYEKQDSIPSAVEILERAIEKGLDDDALKEVLADYYIKNGQSDSAAKLSSDKLVQLRAMIDDNNLNNAFTIIEEIKNDYKKNPKFLSLLAQYYYQKSELDKALECVDEFAKFDKNSPLIYQMKALIYEEKKESYNEHLNWAKYNVIRGNLDVALNEYMFALQENEQDAQLVATIADLLESMNDKTHAVEFYERLIKIEPNNKKALERLAEFRENIGDYQMALEYFEKLYCLDNRNSRVLKLLAKNYEKVKNFPKALEFYNKYISIAASADDYEEIKKKIIKLEGNKKDYNDAAGSDDGLIGWIMGIFSKK